MAKQQKTITVLGRIQFKSDSRKVVYALQSSDGATTYHVHLFDGKVCSCTCPARKPCYHMSQVQAREDARNASQVHEEAPKEQPARERSDRETQEHIAQEQAKAVAEVERTISEQARIATLDAKARTSEHRQSAVLTRQEGFSLLRR